MGMKPAAGFIGLGLMGISMALNLVRAGFPLVVWNRTPGKDEELIRLGATRASSARDAAERSDVLFTIVSDPPALEAVLWGADGAIEGLQRGSVLVDSSTVSPSLARRAAEACAQRGAEFLDAPVTGGTWGAEKGELVFMVGGKQETLDRVRPMLEVLGKKFFHLGPNGAGQTIKLAMNLILALEVEAFAEALALVEAAGLSGERLVEVLQASMARAPVLDVKAPQILAGNFAPSFPLRLMHKDMRLALELASQLGVELPAGTASFRAYSAVKDAAKEDLDYAAIAKFWRKR
jgi:2-hydroxy-3-oxopropionate reductase